MQLYPLLNDLQQSMNNVSPSSARLPACWLVNTV